MLNINYTTFSVGDITTIFLFVLNLLLGIPVCVKKLKSWNRRRSLKQLLEFNEVAIHIPSRSVDRIKPVIAMEDYNAYDELRKILEPNMFNVAVKYIPTSGNIEIESGKANIIICGPKNSNLINETFQRLPGLSFINENEVWFFRDEQTKNKIYSPMDQNPQQNTDLAFIGKLCLSSKPNQPVLLICGIHAIGSLGIAFFLNDKKRLDTLLKKVEKRCFYSIISSEYSENDKSVYNSSVFFDVRDIQE